MLVSKYTNILITASYQEMKPIVGIILCTSLIFLCCSLSDASTGDPFFCDTFCDCIHGGHLQKNDCDCGANLAKCLKTCNCTSSSFSTSKRRAIVILGACAMVIIMTISLTLCCCKCRSEAIRSRLENEVDAIEMGTLHGALSQQQRQEASGNPTSRDSQWDSVIGLENINKFSYIELARATNSFADSHMIGNGATSVVYYGQWKDGSPIAVKKMKADEDSDTDCYFFNELQIMSKLSHPNIMPLLGYCERIHNKIVERLLVFPFMSKGTLTHCLSAPEGKYFMSWKTRVSIAFGVARGLEYLHEEEKLFHQDIKSTNIFLNDNYMAKIADFGLAEYLQDHMGFKLRPRGTFGYMAPDYVTIGKGSAKSDVYSLGIVILELITGRTIFHDNEHLLHWASSRLTSEALIMSELPDHRLLGNFPEEEMRVLAYLARDCTKFKPDSRPSAREVVHTLSTIIGSENSAIGLERRDPEGSGKVQ